jgi:hypothetical protein
MKTYGTIVEVPYTEHLKNMFSRHPLPVARAEIIP